jgi:hypothetical protein
MSTVVGGERRARIAVEGCVSVFVQIASFLSFPEPVKKAGPEIAGCGYLFATAAPEESLLHKTRFSSPSAAGGPLAQYSTHILLCGC